MEKRTLQIYGIPAIIYGTSSRKVFLYVHGQSGYKEEAENFANIACQFGYQVLSVDLPEHGDRKGVTNSFDPWHIVPELSSTMDYAKSQWKYISLFANSIGAWFSMLSLEKEKLETCLFVSPVLDMKQLISKMMVWANVSEEDPIQHQPSSESVTQTEQKWSVQSEKTGTYEILCTSKGRARLRCCKRPPEIQENAIPGAPKTGGQIQHHVCAG